MQQQPFILDNIPRAQGLQGEIKIKRCGDRKETNLECYPAIQFVHVSQPSPEAPKPQQRRQHWTQRDDGPHCNRPGLGIFLVVSQQVACKRQENSRISPVIHFPLSSQGEMFLSWINFVGEIWLVIHGANNVKHPCRMSSTLYTQISSRFQPPHVGC